MKKEKIYFLFILILIISFGLRSYSSALEPYPAILLPSGATKLDLSENFYKVETTSLWALDQENKLVRFTPNSVFSEIPNRNLVILAKKDFGMESMEISKDHTIQYYLENINPSHQISDGKKWIKKRLVQANYNPELIVIKEGAKIIDNRTVSVVEEVFESQRIIMLN